MYGDGFWNKVAYSLKMVGPFNVLQLAGGEKKPPMGYIYEDMDRVTIAKTSKEDERKFKDI